MEHFADGEPTHDPPAHGADSPGAARAGGDLRGLQTRFAYLKALGINTLFLTGLFRVIPGSPGPPIDFRHIRDEIGVSHSPSRITDKGLDPASWKWSASDRLFRSVIQSAHKKGFRIMVQARFHRSLQARDPAKSVHHFEAIAKRWMDPDHDDDPSDGVDGWVCPEPQRLGVVFWSSWVQSVKKINPKALIIGATDHDLTSEQMSATFDAWMDDAAGRAIRRFFRPGQTEYSGQSFLADLERILGRQCLDRQLATPVALSPDDGHRYLPGLTLARSALEKSNPSAPVTNRDRVRISWRLATVVQHLLAGAPMTCYGDELGYTNESSAGGVIPWKKGGPGPVALDHDDNYFASLIQWLGYRRDLHPPLSKGAFHAVRTDDHQRLLAFARTLPAETDIVVINLAMKRQRVTIPAGLPGVLVGVLTPQLHPVRTAKGIQPPVRQKPGAIIAPFRVTGTRQFLDAEGNARFFMEPNSLAIIVAKER